MSQIGLKLTKWWPKQSLVIEKAKRHWAQVLFWKLVKTCPKWTAEPFFFVPNYASSGNCPQKMSPIGLKLMKLSPKQNSVIEKVKPHQARLLFWKLVKTWPKWFAVSSFLFCPKTWIMWSFPIKNELNRTKIDEMVTKTKFGDRKS